MKKFKFNILLLLGILVASQNAFAQNMSDIRINEILVSNTDDFMDDYGHKNGWVELFNTSYGTVDIGGCYFTNDPDNLTMYMIPRKDVLTKIKPRQHTLFWADSEPFRGTFHLNFRLEDSKEILFVSSDGRTIIDRIAIPHESLGQNQSYGRANDGETVMNSQSEVDMEKTWVILEHTSPSTNNFGAYEEPAGMKLMQMDPYGIIMAMTAMSIVFLSLILLYVVFKNTGNYNIRKSKKRAAIAAGKAEHEICSSCEDTPAEVYAAIAMAMHAYFEDDETHDIENTVLTIDKVTRNYSPWSSKIYTLRETPNKK
ncbi:MAG: lamin tail domain-containing protein [Bacteroidia bacterium]|jgi:Na+-transporting methylmalonyl-CoA/oxaloacetate decarboxylase gamma subunit|nr:lamin tail domain-containing protein [Bacteroidia bacterium]